MSKQDKREQAHRALDHLLEIEPEMVDTVLIALTGQAELAEIRHGTVLGSGRNGNLRLVKR